MLNLKAEKVWLSHYMAGIAAADQFIGVPKRRFDIDLLQTLASHPADAARKVWVVCRSAFVFSPTRFNPACDPGALAVASLAKSFSSLAGVAALANLFGDAKLPPTAVSNVTSDLKSVELQWQAVSAEAVAGELFKQAWEGTSSFFQMEVVRECVDELAATISKSGKLRNTEGEVDAWFADRLTDFEFTWAQFMPVTEAENAVLAEYHRWAHDEDHKGDLDCGCPATIAVKPTLQTTREAALYG